MGSVLLGRAYHRWTLLVGGVQITVGCQERNRKTCRERVSPHGLVMVRPGNKQQARGGRKADLPGFFFFFVHDQRHGAAASQPNKKPKDLQ